MKCVLEIAAVEALKAFVYCHEANQTVAAREAVICLKCLVDSHRVNRSVAFAWLLEMFCSDVAALKFKALETLASLVHHDKVNQTAAASAGAVAELLQLGRSDNCDDRRAAVESLRILVANHESFYRFSGHWDF